MKNHVGKLVTNAFTNLQLVVRRDPILLGNDHFGKGPRKCIKIPVLAQPWVWTVLPQVKDDRVVDIR